jgi:hypothetical protein
LDFVVVNNEYRTPLDTVFASNFSIDENGAVVPIDVGTVQHRGFDTPFFPEALENIGIAPERNFEPKYGTFSVCALDSYVSIHESNQLHRNCQSESGSAVYAGRGRIDLRKRFEQAVNAALGNTDPRVNDTEFDCCGCLVCRLYGDINPNAATIREFDRISCQIKQDLPDTS